MLKKLLAEFIGTYFLVFAGTGAIVVNELYGNLTHIGVAAVFGLVVMVQIYTFGHISGAHFNPAVTISFLSRKDMEIKEASLFILSQILGAILASTSVLFILGNEANLGATIPTKTWQQSFVLEFILTYLLVMVILGSAVHGKAIKSFAGLAIGSTVLLAALFGGPISGASMNPARSIGPAFISGQVQYLWIYMIATVLGGLTATVTYQILHE